MSATRTRLADVAALAGVSKSIASRILNGAPGLAVRPETRARVLAAARELEYEPHAFASRLRRAQTGALGLVIPDLTMPVYARIVRGAVRRARELDVAVLLAEDETDADATAVLTTLLRAGRIDGLLVACAKPGHPLARSLEGTSIPHVFVNRAVPASGRNVTIADEQASAVAVDYLVELGHRRIGMVSGPASLEPARRRAAGFRERLRLHGLAAGAVVEGPFTEAGGAEAAAAILARTERPTALFVSTLSQAVGVLHAAWERGVRVPHELSVIAYDDMPLADYLQPPLTTVRMPLEELGAAGVDAVLEQLAGLPPRDVSIETAPHVVSRRSTAGAPS
jgi:LacI family transcriptional regulator